MRKPVEQCRRHLRVAKDAWPFAEGEIGRDDDGSSLIETADKMEEELAARLGEGQIAEFIENHEVEAGQVIGETALPAGPRFAFQTVGLLRQPQA